MRHSSQAGQIGVIVLLLMVVLLTIGLSLALQTTQEVFLSQQRADTTRVFNAAEAGIEQALTSDFAFQGDTFNGTVTGLDQVGVHYSINKVRILETQLFEGITVASDVTGAVAGNGLKIEWSKSNDCVTDNPASLLLSVYSETAGVVSVRQVAVEGCEHNDGFAN